MEAPLLKGCIALSTGKIAIQQNQSSFPLDSDLYDV